MWKIGIAVFIALGILSESYSMVTLRVKVAQVIGAEKVETRRIVSTDYNQDIVIVQEGARNSIILNLKKIENLNNISNGNKINPIQIDMKLADNVKKTISKTQTVTSFYNQPAHFNVGQNGQATSQADINVSLEFEETN